MRRLEAAIEALYGTGGTLSGGESRLFKELYTPSTAMARASSGSNVYACAGSPELMGHSDTGETTFPANPNGEAWAFYGSAEYQSKGACFNLEHVFSDVWKVFGGIRRDVDKKDRTQSAFATLSGIQADGTGCHDGNWQNCFAIVGIGPHDSSIDRYAGRGDLEWRAVAGDVFPAGLRLVLGLRQSSEDRSGTACRSVQQPLTGEVDAIDGTVINGLEIEGAWRINDDFTLRGLYAYLHGDIGHYDALYPFAIPGEAGQWVALPWTDSEGNEQTPWIFGSGEPVHYGGNQLVNQPRHKGSLILAYAAPMAAGMGSADLLTIYNYQSKKYVGSLNLEAYAVDAYTRWDCRANRVSPDSAWTVALYVQDLLDEAAIHLWSPRESTQAPWGTIVEPREFGVIVPGSISGSLFLGRDGNQGASGW